MAEVQGGKSRVTSEKLSTNRSSVGRLFKLLISSWHRIPIELFDSADFRSPDRQSCADHTDILSLAGSD